MMERKPLFYSANFKVGERACLLHTLMCNYEVVKWLNILLNIRCGTGSNFKPGNSVG
jgi:hypothetical protein